MGSPNSWTMARYTALRARLLPLRWLSTWLGNACMGLAAPAAGAIESVVFKEDAVDHAHLLQSRHVVMQFQPDVLADALQVFPKAARFGGRIHILVQQ